MASNYGYSRDIPLAGEAGPTGQGGPSAPRGTSPQEAVKLLSLRVPERPSQGALAPVGLLTSKGSQAAGASGLDSLIAALMQAFRQPTTTDSYQGWMNNERDLSNRGSNGEPNYTPGVLYDPGTGFNPIPNASPRQQTPQSPVLTEPQSQYPTAAPPPRFTPGDTPPTDPRPSDAGAPSLFDNAPQQDWYQNKYEGLDIQGLY